MLYNIKIFYTFASVFHGIRFKVRRLFVVMTSNFFLQLLQPGLFHPMMTRYHSARQPLTHY